MQYVYVYVTLDHSHKVQLFETEIFTSLKR